MLIRLLLLLLSTLLHAAPAMAQARPDAAASGSAKVSFAIIKTSKVRVREALLFAGGSFSREADNNFSAFVIRHGDELLLFDAGLGSKVSTQYHQDMPLWSRPFFKYEDPVRPARDQLAAAKLPPIRRILLSHGHWDHASGIEDFPGAEVWLAPQELASVRSPQGGVGGAWPSQVSDKPVSWHALQFQHRAHEGFDSSLDLFGDGSAVLVTLFGHTPGSMGLFLTVSSGKRFFFVGDVVWSAAALAQGAPKFWAARALLDGDAQATAATIAKIRAVVARDPAIIIVPAHDGVVQDSLGYFPVWVD